MQNGLEKEMKALERKEKKRFIKAEKKKTGKIHEWTGNIEKKIPDKLYETLHTAFYKAFYLVFEKGTGIVEKTFSKEDRELEFCVNDFRLTKSPTRKSLRKMERSVQKGNLRNICMTTAEGVGLGVLGVGLPDIPLFLGVIMKGIYEIALGYGFSYETQEERIFLLRIICGALAEKAEVQAADERVETWISLIGKEPAYDFDGEIRQAADALSRTMLFAKFVQGLPVAGILGGAVNPFIYNRIMTYAALKYKKRYLIQKKND